MSWLGWLLACAEPAPLVSKPAPPTVDLKVEEASVTVADPLEGLLGRGEPALPLPLAEIDLGMAEAPLAAMVPMLIDPARPKADFPESGRRVLGGALLGFEGVQVSFLVKEGALEKLDLALDGRLARATAEAAWGAPARSGVDDAGRPHAVWTGPRVKVELLEERGRGYLQFLPPERP